PASQVALPRLGQEHRATAHPVRAGQPGDRQENTARAESCLIPPGLCLDPKNNNRKPDTNPISTKTQIFTEHATVTNYALATKPSPTPTLFGVSLGYSCPSLPERQ